MKSAYLIPAIIVVLMILLNGTSPYQINRALALAGIAVVGITFIVGPLPKYFPWFNRIKVHRRYLGVSGFLILLIHSILSFQLFFGSDIGKLLNTENHRFLSAFSAVLAFLIFLALTLTSTNRAMRILGPNWKKLQTFGYVGFVLSIIHFHISMGGSFNLFELMLFAFAIAVVAVRIISMKK
ncbi:hypothetical protein JXA56_04420 [Candidatus Micrarchaeota archaeon]|nr:hypothetical protein [Candidatus Micrarchaeota archaeon]